MARRASPRARARPLHPAAARQGLKTKGQNEMVEQRGLGALRQGVTEVEARGGPERRHETLMERAESRGMDRREAEEVYALALEEGLEPELGLLLAASGVGARELERIERDPSGDGLQQQPPEWVAEGEVPQAEAQRERRLRVSFRRFRSLHEQSGSAAEALERFAAEPDVIEDAY